MKNNKIIFILGLILLTISLGYLSLEQTYEVKEVIKEVKLDSKIQ